MSRSLNNYQREIRGILTGELQAVSVTKGLKELKQDLMNSLQKMLDEQQVIGDERAFENLNMVNAVVLLELYRFQVIELGYKTSALYKNFGKKAKSIYY
ncbi:MAG: hypothetical protein GY810_30915, partial [Aureispira sp.]|nr:hypothetical protein [Aureispira sp.]